MSTRDSAADAAASATPEHAIEDNAGTRDGVPARAVLAALLAVELVWIAALIYLAYRLAELIGWL